jgi:hypothetical protein
MLIQFSIENHRSIKDSAVISFAASKDKSLESYLLHPDEKRALLPAIAIYGANAAGKSNVLHALMTMKDMVVGEAAKISKGQKLPWEPFGDTTVPTSFEVVFLSHSCHKPSPPINGIAPKRPCKYPLRMFSPFLGEKDASEYNSVAQDFSSFSANHI